MVNRSISMLITLKHLINDAYIASDCEYFNLFMSEKRLMTMTSSLFVGLLDRSLILKKFF